MVKLTVAAGAILLSNLVVAGGPAKPVTITARAGSAAVVYLSDGTAWEIRPENRPLAATWPAKTPIGVYKVDDRDWQYRLVLRPGKSDGDMVAARKMRRIR